MKIYVVVREDIDGEGGLYKSIEKAYLFEADAEANKPPSNEISSWEIEETDLVIPLTQLMEPTDAKKEQA